MPNPISSEQVMALIGQNQQLLQYLIAKEVGETSNDQEWKEKANGVLMDLLTKAPASTMTAQKLHGLTGTFSTPGLDRDVISTHVRPYGLAEKLPLFPSVMEDPRFGALTGVSDDIGSEPSNPCDNAPSGYIKACNLTAQFGRVHRDTETIEMDKVMLRVNRGDFTDLVLHGFRLGGQEVSGGMYPSNFSPNDVINIITASQMVGVGERIFRLLNKHFWQGNPANNNAGGGYKEMPGLDQQIATAQVDADSGTLCPSLDSDVKNFNYNALSGGSLNIVTYLSSLEYFLTDLAERTGLNPVEWALVMRPQLFYELSAVWPCQYNTNRCGPGAGDTATVFIDSRENVAERDAIRNGKYLDINGRRYNVVLDSGINELNNANDANLAAGEYASSIYFVPLRISGNFPVLYREHVDYRRADSDIKFLRGKERFWTDDGVFSWALEDQKWCYKLSAKTEQRVVLRTPQLAGRLDNVKYSPLQHLRESDPDSPYWVNGGVSVRAVPAKNAVWL